MTKHLNTICYTGKMTTFLIQKQREVEERHKKCIVLWGIWNHDSSDDSVFSQGSCCVLVAVSTTNFSVWKKESVVLSLFHNKKFLQHEYFIFTPRDNISWFTLSRLLQKWKVLVGTNMMWYSLWGVLTFLFNKSMLMFLRFYSNRHLVHNVTFQNYNSNIFVRNTHENL